MANDEAILASDEGVMLYTGSRKLILTEDYFRYDSKSGCVHWIENDEMKHDGIDAGA